MQVQQITPGLWRWTAWHPECKDDVGCVYYEGHDAIVLIDPLVPEDEADRLWRALDRDVERGSRPVHVLITIFWHTRSARQVAERYGARIWAPSRGRAAIERRTALAGDAFRPGAKLPGGVQALSTTRGTEVVYWTPEHRALVPGDVILGGLRLCPESWLPGKTGHNELRASLRPLLDLPVERVLVSHGEPVLANGRAALARALGA
jgi:glyoxylase-like metal-dependent hydrolase (beta-lactamase superfamily II)